ncbi:MAG: YunC family protein [Deltaproteobacteria bacterium]|nr:YunC family protein [Deltaproteobacteria bacterium]
MGEACAIVTGVKTHDDMLSAEVKKVSTEAEKLGVRVGMKGEEALEFFR